MLPWAADPADPATTRRHHHHVVTTTTTTTAIGPSEEQRLNALSGQVSNLQKQSDDTTSEVKKIEAAMTVTVPAQADAKPATIGEHVGLVEKDVGDIKKNLSDNLGISVHAWLMRATSITSISRSTTSMPFASSTRMDSSSRRATCTSSAMEPLDS